MKHLIFLLASTLLTIHPADKVLNKSEEPTIQWIPFKWDPDTISGKYYPKTAILLPLSIEGVYKQFNVQFDLGAGVSMLYGNTFAPFFRSYPALKQMVDSRRTGWINSKKYPYLNVPFSLGDFKLSHNGLAIYKGYGDNLSVREAEQQNNIHIGTIGSDIFQNRILIIDYPNQRIAILDSIPKAIEYKTTFMESKLDDEGRMLIPVSIKGDKNNLLFDTGSSLFNLITDMERWKSVTNQNNISDTLSLYAWGAMKKHYGAPINVPMNIAGKNLTDKIAYGDPDENQERFFNNENIFGITGNSLFFDDVIILDYKNKRFGIENLGK